MPEPAPLPLPTSAVPAPDELKNLLVIVRRCETLTAAGRAYLITWLQELDAAAVVVGAPGSSAV